MNPKSLTDEFRVELGRIVAAFAALEYEWESFIIETSRCYHDTTMTFIAPLGFRQRLKVGFAIATLLEPPDVLVKKLSKVIKTLEKINDRRNEMVHSKWDRSSRISDGVRRYSFRVWDKDGYGIEEEEISLLDLKAFADRIDAAAGEISWFACEFGTFMIQSGIEHGRTEYDWKTGAKKYPRKGRPRKGKPPAVAKRKP
jgi:hypothetical protein